MISVMNGGKVDGNSASSADVSFFGMASPLEERSSAGDGTDRSPRGVGFNKARVSELNLKARVSNSGKDFSGSSGSPSDSVRASESEAGTAAEGSGIRASLERAHGRMNGLKVGDMVWGKVKSHPWWPGYIFNEAFASFPVRKMRREGHVLVAFFGDNSFGWFDPAELIPFDPHFAEKSRQTISRNFAKAVEEAVDEVSRRGALSLACHCCSLNKFRPTAVPGYFLVELPGFEPGGIYSSEQIGKARVNFQPAEALSFVQQIAVVPQRNESSKSVDWIRRVSLILAFRRAVYEEFDETYAQAFGVQPVRPSKNDSGMADQPTRAPLSGPLVIAEALGDNKIPSSSSLKKNKYVLKRRDETQTAIASLPVLGAPGSGSHGASDDYHLDLAPGQQPQASSVISSLQSFREAALPSSNSSTFSLVDKCVLQNRPQVVEDSGTDGYEVLTDSWKLMTETVDARGTNPQDAKPPSVWEDFDDRMLKSEQPPKTHVENRIESLAVKPESKPIATDEKPLATDLEDESGMTVPIAVDSTQSKLEMPGVRAAEGISGTASVDYGLPVPPSEAQETKVALDGAVKKDKVRKHIADDSTGEVRRKKKKKEMKNEARTDLLEIPKTNAELAETELQREQVGVGRTVPPPKLDFASPDLQLPQLLTDLKALALDSFHGIEHNTPDAVRRAFLRFRSKVYRKSLVLAPACDNEVRVVQSSKPADRLPEEPKFGAADIQKKPKPSKSIFRPHDPTMAGRKRGPSDRQEEMSANRAEKRSQLEALARERNARNSQKADQKATTAASQTRPNVTAELVKKREPPPPPKRVPVPTYLVMKFPPRSTLPSVASLKARFARFGTLELDATRVYWKSFTCKVLFKYKSDAEAAMNYGKSNELFGQFKVTYYTRELEATTMEPPSDPEKSRSNDGLQFRPGSGNGAPLSQPRLSLYQQQRGQQGSVQLKSILKKPSDEASPAAGVVVKGVKFMLGGAGDSGRREPPVAVANNSNGSGRGSSPPREPVVKKLKTVDFPPHVPEMHRFAPVSTAPFPLLQTSHDPDIQRFPLPPPSPPVQLLPVSLPPLPPPPPPPPPLRRPQDGQSDATKRSKADISHQMLNLLLRCRDIVISVKSSLGYVPYHHPAWR